MSVLRYRHSKDNVMCGWASTNLLLNLILRPRKIVFLKKAAVTYSMKSHFKNIKFS